MADAPPVAADSATVILVRDGSAGACEVLLVERHAQSRAFAGASVFPGGIVDANDAAPTVQTASRLRAADAHARLGEDVTPEQALAIWIAGVRELFEETGVLLAVTRDVDDLRLPAAALHRRRQALLASELGFGDFVAAEQLVLRTDALRYFSRWITPVQAPRRYDARFFVAPVPPGQEPLHDTRETIATLWIAPADAIARAAEGTLTFAPPTLRILHDLDALGTTAAILAAAEHGTVTPILPRMTTVGGDPAVLFPGDVAYERDTADVASPSVGPCNRMVLTNGAWRNVRRV